MDGELDIISGCYWTEDAECGQIQFLKGNGEMDFAKSVSLQDSEGDPLENMTIKKGEAGDDQLKVICTEQHIVDFDGDKDLDMIVGCFGTQFYYYENKGELGRRTKIGEAC